MGDPKNRTMIHCKIGHSQAFIQHQFHDVNGFDRIELMDNRTTDSEDWYKYGILLIEDETRP